MINETESVITRLNTLTQRVHESVTAMDNALDLKEANDKVADQAETIDDMEVEITRLQSILNFYHIDPEEATTCKAEVE